MAVRQTLRQPVPRHEGRIRLADFHRRIGKALKAAIGTKDVTEVVFVDKIPDTPHDFAANPTRKSAHGLLHQLSVHEFVAFTLGHDQQIVGCVTRCSRLARQRWRKWECCHCNSWRWAEPPCHLSAASWLLYSKSRAV